MKEIDNFAFRTLENHLDKMRTEVELIKKFTHSGEKGREAEGILKKFLVEMLPKRVTVGTGFTMNYRYNVSSQLDIMLYDSNSIPPIFQGYDNSIIYIDALNVSIETKLTYSNEDDVVFTSQKSANEIKRMAIGKELASEKVEPFANTETEENRDYSIGFPYSKHDLTIKEPKKLPLCILFAYSSKIKKPETVEKHLNNKEKLTNDSDEMPYHPGLDIVCVLDLGLFVRVEGKYETYFSGSEKIENNKIFSTLYYIINNHIQNKEKKEMDFPSVWFNGLLREEHK